MSTDVFATALGNSLKEIRNICPNVKCSFLFTRHGAFVAGDAQADDDTVMEKTVRLFQNVAEKSALIGGLDTFSIDGDNGKVYISCVNDMYLAMVMSKDADMPYLRSVTRVIIPTILKLLESIVPTPLKFIPSAQLVVDNLSGFRIRFSSDTVEIDRETLNQWSELFDGEDVIEVEIEAFSGKQAQCKVRAIEDSELEGKGLIRIPDKAFQSLEVKKGELVRVKPVAP